MGKDLTEVRSPQRKLIPDIEDWEQYELTSLRGIAYKAKIKSDYRFRDLSRCLDKTLVDFHRVYRTGFAFWVTNSTGIQIQKESHVCFGERVERNCKQRNVIYRNTSRRTGI